jgi:predicted XRE-type DNA-binding protein/putative component of toxin-antitoxin plasmid stabilization module
MLGHAFDLDVVAVSPGSFEYNGQVAEPVKPVEWMGDSRERIRFFPRAAQREVGQELWRVQAGRDPKDWKPMSTVGPGVREIRVHADGEHRVLYVAKFERTALQRETMSMNIWADIGFSPAEAQDLEMRARMLMALDDFIAEKKLPRAGVAKLFGLTPARAADLMKSRINEFSFRDLIRLLSKAGLRADITIRKADRRERPSSKAA